MSQPFPEQDDVSVPPVVGYTVEIASNTLEAAGLVPAYQDTKGNKITSPNREWFVQPEGENPAGGSSVLAGSQVMLTIAASSSR